MNKTLKYGTILELPNITNYVVVGDIHGCYDEFITMLQDNKGIEVIDGKIVVIDSSKYKTHILIGDLVDKGPKVPELLNFIYDNLEHFVLVIGNHDWWDYLYAIGDLKPTEVTEKLIANWFQSAKLLKDDENLKQKFFHIIENSFHQVRTDDAIITHAPCKNEFLDKTDNVSLKHMRNLSYPKNVDFETVEEYIEERDKFFARLFDDAGELEKVHIFGHTMVPEVFRFKNKMCIDTGCAAGNCLSAVEFDEKNGMVIKNYISKQPQTHDFVPYFIINADDGTPTYNETQ